MVDATDPVALAQALVRCPSVTPVEGGALDLLQSVLSSLGFTCHRLPFSEDGTPDVDNLYARLGDSVPNLCFAGHTDVVPAGATAAWRFDPFAAEIIDGRLYGRGATDMKGAVAAFVGAVARSLAARGAPPGSISLLITGDEEGPAINGTRKVLDWLDAKDEHLDACLVGEPTNANALGDMIKIGRRGSMSCSLTVYGVQGHTAYAGLADNPVHRLITMLSTILAEPLDDGTEHFQPSTIQVTTIDVCNTATNVIPDKASTRFNIRFNESHTTDSLTSWLREMLDNAGGTYDLQVDTSGEAFLTPPGPLTNLISDVTEQITGRRPELGTTGGTSDARFIKDHCPVAEFGLVGQTMHKIDEHATIADIETLTHIYQAVIEGYFKIAVQ